MLERGRQSLSKRRAFICQVYHACPEIRPASKHASVLAILAPCSNHGLVVAYQGLEVEILAL